VTVRNVYTAEDQQMPITELLSKYSAGRDYGHPEGLCHPVLCSNMYLICHRTDTERWYGKDLPFPPEWYEQLEILPSDVLPLGVGDSFAHMDRKVMTFRRVVLLSVDLPDPDTFIGLPRS
jgi:hypothetical protein